MSLPAAGRLAATAHLKLAHKPARVYRPLQARPEREIAIVRRDDRSVSVLCRRFLELLGEQVAPQDAPFVPT